MIISDPCLAKSPVNSVASICEWEEGSALCDHTRGLWFTQSHAFNWHTGSSALYEGIWNIQEEYSWRFNSSSKSPHVMDCLPDSADVLWFRRICHGSTVCLPARTCGHSLDVKLLWRFFERIAKTYRREKWNDLLRPLLATWYACAQQLGDVELGIRLLLEMMGHGKLDISFPTCLV